MKTTNIYPIIVKIVTCLISILNDIVNFLPKMSSFILKATEKLFKFRNKLTDEIYKDDFKPGEWSTLYFVYAMEQDQITSEKKWTLIASGCTWDEASKKIQDFAKDNKGYMGWKVSLDNI